MDSCVAPVFISNVPTFRSDRKRLVRNLALMVASLKSKTLKSRNKKLEQ